MTINSNIKIRTGKKKDLPHILKLIKELAVYEHAPNAVTNTLKDMEKDGFGKNPIFNFHVAEIKNKIAGMALYYTAYSTWKGKYIYLDDIIVTEKHRRKNVGKLLFDELIRVAKENKAKQIRWHVLDWNTPAIDFYKKYNASFDGQWITCKLEEKKLKNLT